MKTHDPSRYLLMVLIAAVGAFASCSDNDDDTLAPQLLEQIVTFAGNSEGRVNFQYQAEGDSPLITLWAAGRLDDKQTPEGTRLLLRYRIPGGTDPAKGGEISVGSLRKILTDTVAILPEAAPRGELYLYSIQRSGEYINMMTRMAATTDRHIALHTTGIADTEGIVDLYLSASEGTKEQTDSAYDATTWASVWIGPVWQQPGISGVRINLNNSNNPYRSSFTFKK